MSSYKIQQFFCLIFFNKIIICVIFSLSLFSFYIFPSFLLNHTWLLFYVLDALVVVLSALLSNYLGVVGVFILIFSSSLLFTLTFVQKYKLFCIDKNNLLLELGPLSKFPGLETSLTLYVDYISYSFALLTALISLCVLCYAFSYMRFERNIINFLIFFKLFGWSMILLVLSGSWFTLILGWELIGITSFLLINFWTAKIATLKSAFKAFVFNKISDAALISAICLNLHLGISFINPSYSFNNMLLQLIFTVNGFEIHYTTIMLSLLIVAAFCKSAQIGFHFWLPDSMEAPVPASALIHSATLVSAGIYLLLRFNYLFISNEFLTSFVSISSAITAFYGAIIASYQTDVKKILAYSTISHCGMLIFSILTFTPQITIFYLFAHGFFKSINFMCVGNFIQYANNYQDVSKMGRYFQLFKFEFYFFTITLFNLSSAPLFFCFFSKHWLINFATTNGYINLIAVAFIYSAAFCGLFYSSKLFWECLMAHKRTHHTLYSINNIFLVNNTYRKANFFSRLAMSVLFYISVSILYNMWTEVYQCLIFLNDDFNTSVTINTANTAYLILLFFSWLIIILSIGFFLFKRNNLNTISFVLCTFSLIFIL